MSTAVVAPPIGDVPLITEIPEHFFVLGKTRFHCIKPDCDLLHHVWCSCAH